MLLPSYLLYFELISQYPNTYLIIQPNSGWRFSGHNIQIVYSISLKCTSKSGQCTFSPVLTISDNWIPCRFPRKNVAVHHTELCRLRDQDQLPPVTSEDVLQAALNRSTHTKEQPMALVPNTDHSVMSDVRTHISFFRRVHWIYLCSPLERFNEYLVSCVTWNMIESQSPPLSHIYHIPCTVWKPCITIKTKYLVYYNRLFWIMQLLTC